MNIKEFEQIMTENLKQLNIQLSDLQLEQFFKYMNILIEWNKVMNLTGITEPKEVIIKHFIDSLTVLNKIDKQSKIIDVGTGAGFPGIPIKIAFPETEVVLLDSLNKRINFLNEVIEKLQLKNIKTIHGRAEDYGKDKIHREKYDIAIARAVAPLNVLLEYLMPFVRINGKCICMKGSNLEEEIENSNNSVKVLGGKVINKEEFFIPNTDIKRSIIEIEKIKNTSNTYPRKAGIPTKKPL
ncbi:MAG: 16S rRNA (guanine(527)-N(7))-methyltransferase RsmG [Clostridia bacterium]|nr:16S rRNA (guanine(527)-N(7))-methyltransferase RsmG [Clostridia bacterium]